MAAIGITVLTTCVGLYSRASHPLTCDAAMSPIALAPKNRPKRSGRTLNSSMKMNDDPEM